MALLPLALPSIPRSRYTDKTFYDLELAQIFAKSWFPVGLTNEYPCSLTFILRQSDSHFATGIYGHFTVILRPDFMGDLRGLKPFL